ncbi:FIST C-terminal domain-containing protein, partial [bacterium]|nr:FIST C-terminal domain-containing protein [bacterium]
ELMVALGGVTDAPFIGGSAGDDLKFKKTSVFCEDKAYSNAAVLALIHLKVPYKITKTQSFSMRDETLTATEVNLKNRSVLSFNNKPAAAAYAEALNVGENELDNSLLTSHPLGLSVGKSPYVRSPQQVLDNQEIKFYCRVEQGSELRVLNNTDIVGDTKKAIDETEFNLGRPVGAMVVFNCILRHLELESRGLTRDFVASFGTRHFIGFSTYGEQYIGHINQTATVLCLAKP